MKIISELPAEMFLINSAKLHQKEVICVLRLFCSPPESVMGVSASAVLLGNHQLREESVFPYSCTPHNALAVFGEKEIASYL